MATSRRRSRSAPSPRRAGSGARRAKARVPAPPPPGIASPPAVLARLLTCLIVAAALSTGSLVSTAERLRYGTTRDAALSVIEPVHQAAAMIGLDLPARLLDRLTGDPRADLPGTTELMAGPAPGPSPEPLTVATLGPPAPAVQPGSGLSPAVPTAEATSPTGPTTPTGPTGPTGPTAASAPTPRRPGPDPELTGDTAPAPVGEPPGPAGSTAPPSTAPAAVAPRMVDSVSKLRVWAGGDSLGEYVGNQLLWPLADRDLTEVELDYRISTGLTRPDYFDWPARITEVMTRDQPPDALVFMVGGNDNQAMAGPGGTLAVGSDGWYQEYRSRVSGIMERAATGTTRLYWIGLPPMRDGERNALARGINAVVAEEAGKRPWVEFVDLSATFAGPDGGFATRVAGPEGTVQVARAPDGVHITYKGSTWVAARIWSAVANHWQLSPSGVTNPP